MAARRSSRALACLVLAAAAAVAAWTGSAAGVAVVAALLSQQVQPALAKDVLLSSVGDESERIAAPMIDNSNLVKGIPFAGDNASRYAPKTTSSQDDDLLLKGNSGVNVLEYVRAKNGWVGMLQFDSAAEEASANKLLEKLR